MEKILSKIEPYAEIGLRWSLGLVFVWFGILKLFSVSPVEDVIKQSLPVVFGTSQSFFFLLSVLEILIGIGFFMKRLVKLAALVMIIHLLAATTAVIVSQGFDPRFPILSLEGEFVLKNLVFIAIAIVILTKKETKEPLIVDEEK